MKNKFKVILSGTLLIAIMAFAISCKETFTEEDALKAQQEIDLAIYVVNGSDAASAPIAGATVTVNQNGVSVTGTTDATGAALFPKVKVGDFVYTVTAANFITESSQGNAGSFNFREGQVTVRIDLISTADADLATIKGTLTVEKDVTNLVREFASSVDVFFDVSLNSGTRTFTTKTDANGAYQIKVPTNPSSSTFVQIRYSDFEADQVIAINRYGDETGSFITVPQILPRKETIKTLFSPTTSGQQFRTIPSVNSIRSVFATVEAPPAGGTQAIIDYVETDAQGGIVDIDFSTGGNYTGDADGKVTVTFVSLDGGTGASYVITLGSNSSVSNAYFGLGTGASVAKTNGAGYPKNISGGFTLNKITTQTPSFNTSVSVLKGTITFANGYYGTGVYRPREIF